MTITVGENKRFKNRSSNIATYLSSLEKIRGLGNAYIKGTYLKIQNQHIQVYSGAKLRKQLLLVHHSKYEIGLKVRGLEF
jgi:hypothetical protein